MKFRDDVLLPLEECLYRVINFFLSYFRCFLIRIIFHSFTLGFLSIMLRYVVFIRYESSCYLILYVFFKKA